MQIRYRQRYSDRQINTQTDRQTNKETRHRQADRQRHTQRVKQINRQIHKQINREIDKNKQSKDKQQADKRGIQSIKKLFKVCNYYANNKVIFAINWKLGYFYYGLLDFPIVKTCIYQKIENFLRIHQSLIEVESF